MLHNNILPVRISRNVLAWLLTALVGITGISSVAHWVAGTPDGYRAAGTFKTEDLVVVNTAAVGGDFAVNTSKFTVTGSNGNTNVAGTLDATGLIGTNAQPHFGAKGVRINSVTGTLTEPYIVVYNGDPNGVANLCGGGNCDKGSMLLDTSTPSYWINTTGSTIWAQVIGAGANPFNGPGSDGTCTFDGVTTPVCGATLSGSTYTMAADIQANTMSVATGVIVVTHGYRIFVFGTLTLTGTANINCDGISAVNTVSGQLGCSAGVYNASGGGGSGGLGANGATASAQTSGPRVFTTVAATAAATPGAGHGQGGGGGQAAGGISTGGGGGAVTIVSAASGGWSFVSEEKGAVDGQTASFYTWGSGGGAGGGDAGGGSGGGGGGAGGHVYVTCGTLAGTGTITARGGNGSAAPSKGNNGSGGGGGGGGGIVSIYYGHRTGSVTCSVTGGSGGAALGTGQAGAAGSDGWCFLHNTSGDGT